MAAEKAEQERLAAEKAAAEKAEQERLAAETAVTATATTAATAAIVTAATEAEHTSARKAAAIQSDANQAIADAEARAAAAEAAAADAAKAAQEAAKAAQEAAAALKSNQAAQTVNGQPTVIVVPTGTQATPVAYPYGYAYPVQQPVAPVSQSSAARSVEQAQQPAPKQQAPAAAATQEVEPEKLTLLQRYYKKSGKNFLSIISVGYSTFFLMPKNAAGLPTAEFAGKRHILNFEIFEWRASIFGMQMFNFEMGLNSTTTTQSGIDLTTIMGGGPLGADGYGHGLIEATGKTMWFAYKPSIKFYIPCTSWLALELYGGVEYELSSLWSKISTSYYADANIPAQNYFFGAYGGLGFQFSAVPAIPLEIKAEYRHPIQGNLDIIPQGFYLTAQLHLGAPIYKDKK